MNKPKNHLSKPCSECPFRPGALPGYLGPYETPEELHRLVMSETPFPCHKTMRGDIAETGYDGTSLCAGSVAYMKRNCKTPRDGWLAAAVDAADPEHAMYTRAFVERHRDAIKSD